MQNVKVIKTILRGFELASGLKINFAKSCFGAVEKSDQWRREAAEFLNCRILPLPFTYLGIPIGANPRRSELWDPVIRKCERKLARWKQKHLSFGGRVTLIQSTLSAIPIYFLSFFRLPDRVADKLIGLLRRFLWGGGSEQRKITWVKWEIVCLPKEKGGLGIKDIRTFNKALLGKWRWDMLQQNKELWSRILDSKYGGWRSLVDGKRVNNESVWWQDLMEVTHDQQLNNVLQDGTTWRVGCGDKIRFWEDCSSGNGESLILKYPRLYQISRQQQKLIEQVGSFKESAWEWNLSWRRPLFDNEVASTVGFMEDISQIVLQQHTTDCRMWKPEPNGYYSTRSAYNLLQGSSVEVNLDGALQDLWKLKLPAKASIFAWRLIRDRLPTKSNLQRRQVEINDSMCPFCRNKEEDASHLFFDCSKSQPLCWESLSWIGTLGAYPIIPRHHFMQHENGMNGGKKYNRWKCGWVALTWSIWQHRIKVIFLNEPFNGSKLMEDALFLL